MNNEFLFNIKYLSVEVVVIAIIIFGLTMLIKYPIKKVTAKLEENKRLCLFQWFCLLFCVYFIMEFLKAYG